jgi:large subunit ribosomal protein L29
VPRVKAEELRTLDEEELTERLRTTRRELYELRFKLAVGQLDDHRKVRKVRKDIARILTVIRARELELWQEVEKAPGAEPVPTAAEAVEPRTSEPVQAEATAPEAAPQPAEETPEHVEAQAPRRRQRARAEEGDE